MVVGESKQAIYQRSEFPLAKEVVGLSERETIILVQYLIELMDLGRKFESVKMDLACCNDFNLMDGFSLFDELGKGYCGLEEFTNKLQPLGLIVSPSIGDIQLVFKRYNKSNDGLLKYSEFMHAMSPLSEAYSSALRNRKVKNIYNRPRHPV